MTMPRNRRSNAKAVIEVTTTLVPAFDGAPIHCVLPLEPDFDTEFGAGVGQWDTWTFPREYWRAS
jgi:hypothetical protein